MVSSNMKIISCVRFELDFRGQIFTDDAGYFLRITYCLHFAEINYFLEM